MPRKYSTCMLAIVTTSGRATPTTMKCAPLASSSTPTGY
jgi:hypothetical protein